MTPVGMIVGIALGIYGIRLAGFVLADLPLSPTLESALRFVPLAMLTALCVATLPGHGGDSSTRLVAAGGAAIIARVTRRVWACILGGMALYWLLEWLLAPR
jgi:branched-subunit amino acid transport protein